MRECTVCRLPRPEGEATCGLCGRGVVVESVAEETPIDRMIRENRLREAFDGLEELVRRGEESPESCRRLAWIGWAIDDIRAVQNWCHEWMRLDDRTAEPHLLMGLVLESEDRWHEAWEESSAGLKRRPLTPEREGLLVLLRQEAAEKDPQQ